MCHSTSAPNHFDRLSLSSRERVIQAELQPTTGRYKVRVRGDTYFFENTEFRDDITEEQYRAANKSAKRRTKKCGKDEKGAKT